MTNKQACTAFDIDGTIWPLDIENMWLRQLVEDGFLPQNIIKENQKFLQRHRKGNFDEVGYLDFFLKHFREWDLDRLQRFSKKVFQKVARPNLYQEALTTIKQLKEGGGFNFLLTAANNVAAAPFGEYLGVDAVVSTELEFDINNRFTGNIVGPYCYGFGKVKKSLELCSRHGLDLADCTYFGDSLSDINMFERVKRAVVVNPATQELENYARKNQWEIVHW